MRKLEDGNIRRKREVSGQTGGLESLLWKTEARRLEVFQPPKRLCQEQLVQPRYRGSLSLRRDG